jgi:lipopolysaccharide transport system ATP-binding protein
MSEIAIRATNISKQYTIGAVTERHNTLRDEIMHGVKSLVGAGRRRSNGASRQDTIWAVKEVSFQVNRGEVLGIVGKNGAGKSTILKILSRITEPTTGRCELYGRIGSLLEVGTGFHGELTGRENVYFNGAMLGMTRAEISRKFDEIVAFAEIEKFIDTPVKRYSSGMYVRLGFAVAAHLEPEILVVDEVLAVGDLKFQNKCLGKLGDVARQGRTVLFVSHNMGAVANLCTAGLWIEGGQVLMQEANARSVVEAYIKSQREQQVPAKALRRRAERAGADAQIVAVQLLDATGQECNTFMMGETLRLEFDIEFYRSLPSVNITIEINRSEMGMRVLQIQNDDSGFEVVDSRPGKRRFRMDIPNCMLYPTGYEVMMAIWSQTETVDFVESVASFSMIQSDVTRRTTPLTHHRQAIYFTPTVWTELPPV